MADPLVIQAINRQRAALLAQEQETMRVMFERWQSVEASLRADQLDLAMYLDDLRARGETITTARLMQMERYQTLIADARTQQAQYSRWAADNIAQSQQEAISQGVADAQRLIEAAYADARIAAVTFDRINAAAVNYLIGFAADGSPLYDLLRASYPETVVSLTDALINGLAKGLGPRSTAKLMVDSMAGNLDRALLIARTEQLRALRAGNQEQFKASNVVKGYLRRSQRNSTVCPACLALDDGVTIYPTDELFAQHPNDQCYMQPVLRFGKTPSFPGGQEWLATQPESVQRKILGAGKYELYQSGSLDWSGLAKVENDPTWGPTVKQGTVAEATA